MKIEPLGYDSRDEKLRPALPDVGFALLPGHAVEATPGRECEPCKIKVAKVGPLPQRGILVCYGRPPDAASDHLFYVAFPGYGIPYTDVVDGEWHHFGYVAGAYRQDEIRQMEGSDG